MNSLIGKAIGQYRIISEVGRGGMAEVYKAEQPSLNRFVALKVLFPNFTGDASSVERLQREAQTAAGLDHPNIVDIYEVGEQDGLHYIAMKYIEGRPLDKILEEEKALSADRSLRILAQVASALDYAHRQNLVHRDIKPSNILVGEGDRVTLTDFGLVKAMGSSTLTSSGALVGTPIYMSPEQARGVETDYRGDIYSLGVVSYEMLTGRPPFTGNPLSIILAHASQRPPALRSLRAEIPPWVEAAVLRSLEKEPGDRYITTGAFVATLRQALTWRSKDAPPGLAGIVSGPPSSGAETHQPPGDARSPIRFVWAIAAVILVVMAVVLIGIAITNSRDKPASATLPVAVSSRTAAAVADVATATPISPTETAEPSATPSPTPISPTSTVTSTEIPVVVVPTETATPQATATDTETPTAVPTETPTTEPSATDTVAPTAPPTLTATAEPSPTTPPATRQPAVPAIVLTGPLNGRVFATTDAPTLTWSRSAPLQAGEQFVVVIDRIPLPPNTGVWHDYHITSETSLTAPSYLTQSTADGQFEWYVKVMRSPRVESGTLFGTDVGQPSSVQSFIWLPAPPSGGEPGGPAPTPTRDD